MTNLQNIEAIAELSPDFLGFIFWEKSVRKCTLEHAPPLPEHIRRVGVFVNESLENIETKAENFGLAHIQLHGNETADFCAALKQKGYSIIKAFSVDDTFDFDALQPYAPVVDYFLFDTKGKLPGGNGYTFDWKILENYTLAKPYFLSGGIGLEELGALQVFLKTEASKQCETIDLNSKFEIQAGIKNPTTLKKMIDEIYGK